MHLTVSLAGSGYHPAAWRVSSLPPAPGGTAFQAMARTAERGRLDAVLLGLQVGGSIDRANTLHLDPLPLLGSVIGATRQIGLGAAWTVDFTEPYNVARVLATLDHLSYGRTGWIARMFGAEALQPRIGRPVPTPDLPSYCARTAEFIDVVKELWDSWEDEAFALDKPSGMFVDPERVTPIAHAGRYFSVRGPLNVPRPPQGNPVLIQADTDTVTGETLIAATADVVLTCCATPSDAVARARALRGRVREQGRAADVMRILATMMVILAETETEADQRVRELDAMQRCALPRFVGTPAQLVEMMAAWHEQGGCDGFNILPAVLPLDLDQLVDGAVPLLQRHGMLRTAYSGATLRDHLGLSRPRSRYAVTVARRSQA